MFDFKYDKLDEIYINPQQSREFAQRQPFSQSVAEYFLKVGARNNLSIGSLEALICAKQTQNHRLARYVSLTEDRSILPDLISEQSNILDEILGFFKNLR